VTNLTAEEDQWAGYPVLKKGKNTLQFALPSRDHISPLLEKIIRKAWIHHVEIENIDLESIYFKVRGGRDEY
jgi:ABC-2 type transport system ATP-binding protein